MNLPRTVFEYALLAVRQEWDEAIALERPYDHVMALQLCKELQLEAGVESIDHDLVAASVREAEDHMRRAQ